MIGLVRIQSVEIAFFVYPWRHCCRNRSNEPSVEMRSFNRFVILLELRIFHLVHCVHKKEYSHDVAKDNCFHHFAVFLPRHTAISLMKKRDNTRRR